MVEFFIFCFLLCIGIGLLEGIANTIKVKKNPKLGVKPSNNIFTFLFMDKYE